MNAMLDPRIVTARIQGLALALHITPSAADGSTTSQGILMATMDAADSAVGSKDHNEQNRLLYSWRIHSEFHRSAL
jgi:hypothetical protein